ncbi:winged helix-turn-helix domain-containing protein [Stenotrophomonas sp. NA06056]|uniref:winged helix-turn-helix domain-containing protein n=1 Tax=Stenotrophomonas sp. NA06056 TaxID=2742129 RepID=UPI00158EF05E|nr:winged helix-turn-helix domain-containing protein [Stenotrophomonas sp. NA06056]QKW56786.1 winged helix-turn-helix domain-containing protein [Stenotrophomonas sp. NA06056]
MTAPWPSETQALQVGDLLLDLRYRRIVSLDSSIELQHRVFDLLLLLVSEPDKLFTRNELFDRLWTGLVVDDANLSQSVWLLRKALGESRREWIRTVAKRGYVFQPPGPVRWFPAMPSFDEEGRIVLPVASEAYPAPIAPAASVGATSESSLPLEREGEGTSSQEGAGDSEARSARKPEPNAKKLRRPGSWLVATAAIVLICVAAIAWQLWPRGPAAPIYVAMMPVQANSGLDTPWASELLRQWSSWKLQQLPAVRLVSGEALATGKHSIAPSVVLVSAVRSVDGRQVTVRARIQRHGKDQLLQQTVPTEKVPGAVDALSRQLLEALVPGSGAGWPVLDINASAAQRYAPVGVAFEQRDWHRVQVEGTALLNDAPRFGLLHLQLAIAQSNLGESLDAVRQMELANQFLTPLPPDALASLRAQQLEVDPRRARDAERAIKSLVSRHPDFPPYRERYAQVLNMSGQFQKAIKELERPEWMNQESIDARYQREMLLSQAHLNLGKSEAAISHARAARELAQSLGPGMRTQAADAALREAHAVASTDPGKGAEAFRQAARLFVEAGSDNLAHYALTQTAIYAGEIAPDGEEVRKALDRTRQSGALDQQLNIQVALANISQDQAQRLRWIQEALLTARSMGNLTMQASLEAELALDDLLQTRVSNAQARAIQMQALGLDGVAGAHVNAVLSWIYLAQGKLEPSRLASQRALESLPLDDGAISSIRSAAACSLLLYSTYMADRQDADALATTCQSARSDASRFGAAWMQAQEALLLDDRVAARQHYQQALALIDADPQSATQPVPVAIATGRLRVARVAVRIGDRATAARLAGQITAANARSPLPPLTQLELAVLNAEVAAAGGDWRASRNHSQSALEKMPEGLVELRHRLDLLSVADAERHGQAAVAVARAKSLFGKAKAEKDVRVQQQVLSLVSAGALGLVGPALAETQAGRRALPGATLVWLGPRETSSQDRTQPVKTTAGHD